MFRFAGKSSAGAAESAPSRNRYTISWKPTLRKLKNSLFFKGNTTENPETVQQNDHGASVELAITTLFDKKSYQPLNNQRATLRPRTANQNHRDTTRRLSSCQPKQSNDNQQPGVVNGIELIQRPSAVTTDKIRRRTTVHGSSTPPPPKRNPSRVSSREPPLNIQARPSSYAPSSPDTDEFSMALRKKLRRASMAHGENISVPKPVAYVPSHAASDFLKNGSPSERSRRSVRQKKDPYISTVDENSEDFQNFVKNCHLQHLVREQDRRQTRISLPVVVVKAPEAETATAFTKYDAREVQDFQSFLRKSHIHYMAEEDRGWRQSIAIAELDEETENVVDKALPPNCFATPKERGLSTIQRRQTTRAASRRGSMASGPSSITARPVSIASSILGKVGEYVKPTMPVNAQRDSMILSTDDDAASFDSEIPVGRLKRWSMAAVAAY